MFILPMACLLLAVSAQAGMYDNITDPDKLIAEANRVVARGETSDLSSLIQAVQKLMEKTTNEDQKERLTKTSKELNYFKQLASVKNFDYSNTNQEIDQNLFHQINTLFRAIGQGKESFLACRPVIKQTLNEPRNQNPFNRSNEFQLRKALQDMDRLEQLDKDPALRPKTENILGISSGYLSQFSPGETLDPTSLLQHLRQTKADSTNLFGSTSFFNFQITVSILGLLETFSRRGEMAGVDLEAECNSELGPFLNSEWSEIERMKRVQLKTKAYACLCAKEKNYEKLLRISTDLDNHKKKYSKKDSFFFIETLSYRMVMLTQLGRFQECLQEFQKFGTNSLGQVPTKEYTLALIDIYLSAAAANEALGKKDQALLYQELAFGYALEFGSIGYLTAFRKSVAKELRDKYAKNNQWKEARNLEERCKLLGIGFDPLPKQAFE